MNRVKKLHVDRHVPRERETALHDVWTLVQRLSRCARGEVNIQATEELIGGDRRWLEAGTYKELVRPILSNQLIYCAIFLTTT
jgi:hypothetical protein